MGMGTTAEVKPYPAIALGSFEATPLEMATAYNVLANGGLKIDPVTVLSGHGRQGHARSSSTSRRRPRVARPGVRATSSRT